jgi:dTDP-4-dehydrorhamnose reductase
VKALVLGASGFLGSYLGFALPRLGWETTGLSRHPAPWFGDVVAVDSGDAIRAHLAEGGYDVVINAIAIASHEVCEKNPDDAFHVNATLPGQWAKACRDTGMRFVHISTDAVFDGTSEVPYIETDEAQPHGVYGRSKLAGELAVLEANPEALVARTNFFGWSASGSVGILDFFVSAFDAQRPITGFTDYQVSSLYVGHLVAALHRAVEVERRGVVHVVASGALSKFDFGLAVAREFGLDARCMSPGTLDDAAHLSTRGKNLALATGLIEQALGRPMESSVEGLRQAQHERALVMDYFGVSRHRGDGRGN